MLTILPLEIELGILAGLAVAISGYIQAYSNKDKEGKREKFSVDKFTTTVLLGGVSGALLSFVGSFQGSMNIFLINAGIVAIVGSLIKAFLRIK